MNEVLFVCTGNYYRSRYAEALFNYLASTRGLNWRAFSRGLAIHLAEGDLSLLTRLALIKAGISLKHTAPGRTAIGIDCLERAKRVIVLDEKEHRPYILKQFPEWEDRVEYWDCGDIQFEPSESCLPRITQRVQTLIDELSAR